MPVYLPEREPLTTRTRITFPIHRLWLWRYRYGCALAFLLPGGCGGQQSALAPAGTEAHRIAELFWWMSGVGIVVWVVVIGLAVYVTHANREPQDPKIARWLIIGGGVALPTVVLASLLVFGLSLLASLREPVDADLSISVSGEQWWWRVHYQTEDGAVVPLANEIRLPVGKKAEFRLSSPDVIHSFWIPSLGGKVDMIPGRVTRLVLEPIKTGVYRGACAEYCGTSHALMNFMVKVVEPEVFQAWLQHQASPAEPPRDALAREGKQLFLANGCGACHRIRGTSADGGLGPDLTHVGSRLSLGAGILDNTPEAFARWIGHTDTIKPDVYMPEFSMLPERQLTAMAAYLEGLQ